MFGFASDQLKQLSMIYIDIEIEYFLFSDSKRESKTPHGKPNVILGFFHMPW